MKRCLAICLLFCLPSIGLFAQCVDVRFGKSRDLDGLFPGNPQYVCLPQCTTDVCDGIVVYASVATSSIQSASWDIIGDPNSTIIKSVVSPVECKFSALGGSTPYDWGKARVVYRYLMKGEKCTCTDTLDFYKMAPNNQAFFSFISGPACLAPGETGLYFVDPRFSRPQNLALAIGNDSHSWLLPSGTGNGIWATPAAGFLSGDKSAIQIQAPPTGWTNATATLRATEGNTCNTFQVPFTITRGNPGALITVTPTAPLPYTAVVANESYLLPANSAQAITLTAPAGASMPYTWLQDGSLGYTLAVSGTMNETCVVTPNSGVAARSGRISLISAGCAGAPGTIDYVEIRRTLISPTNFLTQPAGCRTAGTNVTLSIANPPGGAPSNYIWNITNGATGWPATPITTTLPSLTVVPSANAQPAIFQCQLNGQTLSSAVVAPGALMVSGSQGYTFTMPASVNVGLNTIRYDIFTTDFSPTLPVACLESNLHFDWTYSGGTNANFTTPDGCGYSTANIVRAVSGNAFGGGTLSVIISARGPSNICTDCGLSCLQVSASANPGTRARPGKGGEDPPKITLNPANPDARVEIYPNPVNDLLTLVSKAFSETHLVEIFDAQGKKHKVLNPQEERTVIDIRNFPKGSYLIRYHFDEGSVITKMFVKN